MIDFYIKELIQDSEIYKFLEATLHLTKDDIFLCDQVTLETSEISQAHKCLCIKYPTEGDASILLQLWRVVFDFDNFVENAEAFCIENSIACYIPYNNFDDFFEINSIGNKMKVTVSENSTEDKITFTRK